MFSLMLALALAQETEPIRIVVADQTIHPGDRIVSGDLRLTRTFPEFVPTEAITSAESLIGEVVRETIYEGEYIRAERLAPKGSPEGVRALVPETLLPLRWERKHPSPKISGGDVIDIISLPSGCLVVQGVSVLGIETETSITTHGDPSDPVAWHLAVSQEQARRLTRLNDSAVVLRSEIDFAQVADLGCP